MPLMITKNKLREIRKSKKLSGYDLQILSTIPARTLYEIERGLKRPLPYQKALISDALEMDEQEIFPNSLESPGNWKVKETNNKGLA